MNEEAEHVEEEIPEYLRPAGEGYLYPTYPKSAHNPKIKGVITLVEDIPLPDKYVRSV